MVRHRRFCVAVGKKKGADAKPHVFAPEKPKPLTGPKTPSSNEVAVSALISPKRSTSPGKQCPISPRPEPRPNFARGKPPPSKWNKHKETASCADAPGGFAGPKSLRGPGQSARTEAKRPSWIAVAKGQNPVQLGGPAEEVLASP